jgi:hypothetical protein
LYAQELSEEETQLDDAKDDFTLSEADATYATALRSSYECYPPEELCRLYAEELSEAEAEKHVDDAKDDSTLSEADATYVAALRSFYMKRVRYGGEFQVKQAKGNPEEAAKVRKEIEEYMGKLQDELKYSKQDVAKDPDMLDLQTKLSYLGGK